LSEFAELERRISILEDILAIERLRSKYWYTLDNKLWDEFAECFTEDFVLDGPPGWQIKGRRTFVEQLKKKLSPRTSIHLGHSPSIDITSETTARGRWALHDIITDVEVPHSHGYAYYQDQYVKEGIAWKIKNQKLTYSLRDPRWETK